MDARSKGKLWNWGASHPGPAFKNGKGILWSWGAPTHAPKPRGIPHFGPGWWRSPQFDAREVSEDCDRFFVPGSQRRCFVALKDRRVLRRSRLSRRTARGRRARPGRHAPWCRSHRIRNRADMCRTSEPSLHWAQRTGDLEGPVRARGIRAGRGPAAARRQWQPRSALTAAPAPPLAARPRRASRASTQAQPWSAQSVRIERRRTSPAQQGGESNAQGKGAAPTH